MKVTLITHTPMPEKVIASSAKLCYSAATIDTVMDGLTEEKTAAFVDMLSEIGHESPIEHASFTFGIEGVSRALLAQLTRHRMASYSVQSQRYVSMADGLDYVIPPSISALGEEEEQEFIRQMDQMHAWYCQWQEKLGGAKEKSNEDARFVLPNAASTRLLVTMNARELLHFFELRCCNRAQWEIREMAWQMLGACRKAAPALFEHAGPACLNGPCPEGRSTCGKAKEVKERHAAL